MVHGPYLPDESLLHIHEERRKFRLAKSVFQICFGNVFSRILRAQGKNFLQRPFSTLYANLAIKTLFFLEKSSVAPVWIGFTERFKWDDTVIFFSEKWMLTLNTNNEKWKKKKSWWTFSSQQQWHSAAVSVRESSIGDSKKWVREVTFFTKKLGEWRCLKN